MTIIDAIPGKPELTYMSVNVTGFEATLAEATRLYNAYSVASNPAFIEIEAAEYLQVLVTRQLEGLGTGTQRIASEKEVAFSKEQAAIQRQSSFAKALPR